jgi:N-acetylmuramoyl-L-alanine amidase
MNKLFIGCLIFSSLLQSNEISFNQVTEPSQNTIEISFILENVAFIKSYSLESPSRIVLDVFDSKLKSDIDEVYNYPVKKIRASKDKNITRIVIDLYEYVYWKKPIQTKTDNGVILSLEITKTKKLKTNMRDIIVAIDAGHGGKYPGAVGTNNILEKDVTLLIAKQLERTLKDTEGFSPLMIRTGDETQ